MVNRYRLQKTFYFASITSISGISINIFQCFVFINPLTRGEESANTCLARMDFDLSRDPTRGVRYLWRCQDVPLAQKYHRRTRAPCFARLSSPVFKYRKLFHCRDAHVPWQDVHVSAFCTYSIATAIIQQIASGISEVKFNKHNFFFFFYPAFTTLASFSRLILEVPRSHTRTHHSR